MYVKPQTIEALQATYGVPERASFHIPVFPVEYERIRRSQKNDRKHDVTLYIRKGDYFIVIAKHFYPPGMYRAPSGGLEPGEDFVAGAQREALEETGCRIELEKFLLIAEAVFSVHPEDGRSIEWSSFVFEARYLSGDFNFTDRREIREVRLARLDEFEVFSRIMRDSKIGGLHYRAALHDRVRPLLSE